MQMFQAFDQQLRKQENTETIGITCINEEVKHIFQINKNLIKINS